MKHHKYISLLGIRDELCSRFSYDANTGLLTYLKDIKHNRVGDIAGYKHKSGYLIVKVNTVSLKVHRIAWFLHYGYGAEGMIDHIDGDRCNNQISNLRVVSFKDNSKNRGNNKNNSTGAKGVVKRGSKFYARIGFNGIKIFIGSFSSLEDAAQAYKDKASELYGDMNRDTHTGE